MSLPRLPSELSASQWERQAGPLAKAKPTTVADALSALQKGLDGIEPRVFDAEKLTSPHEAEQRLNECRIECDRKLKALGQQAGSTADAARKWEAGARKTAPKPALQAALAIAKAADGFATTLRQFGDGALAEITAKRDELQAAAQAATDKAAPETPEQRRLRERVNSQLRIVRMRSDRKVMFLLCVGHKGCAAYLAPTISEAQKPLLLKTLKGDSGFKFFRGECVWEESAYTFVGTRMTKAIARKIELGFADLTGTRFRIRAREGDSKSKDEDA